MNSNNRSKIPASVPRLLRPKVVSVSPIKSPLGNVVPQMVLPLMTSQGQGQGQYMSGGNIVPQVYQAATISQTMPVSQPRMTAQALYPQTGVISQNLPVSQPRMTAQAVFPQTGVISQTLPVSLATQPRMTAQALYPQTRVISQNLSEQRITALYPQSGVVSQNLSGGQSRMSTHTLLQQSATAPQTTPGSQPRIGAQALYPQVGALSQNLPASQPRMSAQVVYPQSVQVGSQMPVVQNRVSMVQSAGPVVQSNVPMIVSAAPVFQNLGFQQRGQLAYPTQINPQTQPRQPYAFPSQIASNVQSPVFSPAVTNATNPFQQQNYSVSNQIRINPAFITSHNQGVINQMSRQPVLQQNIVPRLVQMNQAQNIVRSQLLPTVNPDIKNDVNPEIKNDVPLNQVVENESSDTAEQVMAENVPSVAGENTPEYEGESSEIVSEGESIPEANELGQLSEIQDSIGNVEQSKTDSDTYTEMTLDDSLISDAQFGMRSYETKNVLEEPLLMSSEQNSPVVADNMMSDSRESSSMSNLVTPSDIEEMLLFPPSFDTETSQSSQASMDFVDSPVDSKNSACSEELTKMEDSTVEQEDILPLPYSSIQEEDVPADGVESYIQIGPMAESEDSIQGPSETDEDHVKDDLVTDKPTETVVGDAVTDKVALSQNISETGEQSFEATDGVLLEVSPKADDEVSEIKDTDSIHSNIEIKTSVSAMADTNSQPSSSEDSQDVAVSSDICDIYTDDSNSMSWEHFHHTVLNLRANKNRDNAEVPYTSLRETPRENTFSSCDIGSGEPSSSDVSAENETAQMKSDGPHEQSFEGEVDEPEFVWEDFLQQTGSSAVPPTAFKHVECSLQSGFIKGMKLEVPNKSDPDTYWVASVLMTCGPLLRLRYDGYGEESSGDFWCDLGTTEIHPIGWSAQNGKNLQPPDEIGDRVSDWRTFLLESLTGARTAPSYFFEKGAGCSPVDQLKCGMKLELQDILNPLHVWLVQILENIGGRLYLRLEGPQSASKHFWMFYLNPRLHPIGWANEHEGCIYRPPQDIYDEQTDESWAEFLQAALKECEEDFVPDDVFKDQQELKRHQFAVGMKLEALNPGMNTIGPATVTKVINNLYFIVEMDDLRKEHKSIQICCTSEYLGIFPISWCQCKGIRLSPPHGWSGGDFVWGEYLSMCNAKGAPERLFNSGTDDHDFERGLKLEAVNPDNPNQICAATITKIVGPLLWIHLDHMRDIPSHIEDIDSHNLFPVGWCESNNYQLKPPIKAKQRQKHVSERKTEEVYRSVTSSQTKGAWCPTIYFNHRCFSGPYLSKGRISDLPKHVGPGPMDLVLREVLSLLISMAYVPCRALKEIQQEGPFNPSMKAHILKAKYKGKKYKAIVEVCHKESQLEEFCRNTCIKLECCPYLFSPLHVRNSCPENCQQLTKTKSNPNYGKKRKLSNFISVKPNFPDDGSREQKKRGRKKKRLFYIQKKGHGQRQYDANGDLLKDEGFIDDDDEDGMMASERRRYDIQTRGAKLPKYSFEKKSHRKILMSQTTVHADKHKQGLKRLLPKAWPVEVKNERPLVPREGSMKLESNPLNWTVTEVVQFLKATDCSHLARMIKEQEVDGQAFLLMNLSAIQEHLQLKLGPAVKLCHQIERLKLAFYENYA